MKETLGYSPSITSKNRKPLATRGDARLSIAVLGKSCVGKTALTVQYLTGRFIGDYCSGQDMTYRTSVPHLGGSFSTPVDILDTFSSLSHNEEVIEKGHSYWTRKDSNHRQAYLVVYSLTNATSFDLAKEILHMLPSRAPKFLAANQLDLQHRRQVSREEGQTLADNFSHCQFDEFSAADPLTAIPHDSRHIKCAIDKLIRQLISSSPQCVLAPYCPRIFSKLLGTLAVIKEQRKERRVIRSIGFGGSIGSTSMSSSCSSSCGSTRSCSPVQHDTNLASLSASSLVSSDDGLMLPLVGERQNSTIKEQIPFPVSILLHHLHLTVQVC